MERLFKLLLGNFLALFCILLAGSYLDAQAWSCAEINNNPNQPNSWLPRHSTVAAPGNSGNSPYASNFLGMGDLTSTPSSAVTKIETLTNNQFLVTVERTSIGSGKNWVQCTGGTPTSVYNTWVYAAPGNNDAMGRIYDVQNVNSIQYVPNDSNRMRDVWKVTTNGQPATIRHKLTIDELQFCDEHPGDWPSCPNGYGNKTITVIDQVISLTSGPISCSDTLSGSSCNIPSPKVESPKPEELGPKCCKGDPIDIFSGNYTHNELDLSLSGVLPINIIRNYYSSKNNVIGDFGVGSALYGLNYTLKVPLTLFGKVNSFGSSKAILDLGNSTTTEFLRLGDGHDKPFLRKSDLNTASEQIIVNVDGSEYLTGSIWKSVTGEKRYFDVNGFYTAYEDRAGNRLEFTRDLNGRLQQVTDMSTGRNISLTYNGDGLISQLQDSTGRTVTYTYSPDKELLTVTNPAGNSMAYTWDSNHRIVSKTDFKNVTRMTNTYSPTGAVQKQTDANGKDTLIQAYSSFERKVIDPKNHASIYRFNEKGYLIEIEDALGHKNKTIYSYSMFTDSQSDRYYQDEDGLGESTYNGLNGDNLLVLFKNQDNKQTTIEYAPTIKDKPKKITDPLGHITQFEYDSAGNLTKITDNAGNVTNMTYNAKGQVLTVTSPLNQVTTFAYDDYSQLKSITDPLNNKTDYAYDARGNITKVKSPKGYETQYAYDVLDNVTSVTDALNNTTTYTYDDNNNLESITNGRGKTSTYAYDAKERLISVTNPNNQAVTYAYDDADNLVSVTDAKGQVITNTYDNADRLTQVNLNGAGQYTYTYDNANQITDVNDGSSNWNFRYDSVGRVVRTIAPQGTIVYTYNVNSKPTQLTDSNYGTVTYGYDAVDRLISVTKSGNVYAYTYDPLGRRTAMTLPNGIARIYEYDAASRLKALTHVQGLTALERHDYDFDADNNILNYIRGKGTISGVTTTPAGNGQEIKTVDGYTKSLDDDIARTYEYDELDRLKSVSAIGWIPRASNFATPADKAAALADINLARTETNPVTRETLLQNAEALGAVLPESASWTFDENGNIKTKGWRLPGGSTASKTLTYDNADRMTGIAQSGVSPSSITLTYDNNGNLTGDSQSRTFTWNALNQLTAFSKPSVSATYSYDPLGRRKQFTKGSSKTYFYDGLNVLSDGTAKYLLGPGVDENLQYDDSSHSWNYYQDHLGSTTQLRDANSTANAVSRYDYASYGKLEGGLTGGGTFTTPITYTGREDDGTGLYYYRARYYDPDLEMFVSQDPLGKAQRYVGGNPLRFIDPYGLMGVGITIGGSAEAGVVAGAGATGSLGAGVFGGGSKGINIGGFASGGAFAGGPGFGACSVGNNKNNGAIGAYAGVGAGAFLTNANSASDLAGNANTTSLNLGIGPKVSGQFSIGSNGIWSFGLTVGPGGIFSLSNYGTTTVTTK